MKISSSQRNLLSIFALCVLAFWGFGSIFSDLNLSISAEISTAAFGALFIILTTKFLMEQENDATRKQFVYQQNVEEYKKYAKLQMNVLEDGTITKEEINQIKMCHALLLITGSEDAIKYSNTFLQTSIEAFNESDGEQIPDPKRNELVECTAKFLLAARSGLYLPNAHINEQDQIKLFLESEEKSRKLVRQATSLEENKDYINRDEEGRRITEKLIQKIEDFGYYVWITASQVTVYSNAEFKRGTAVCFINSTKTTFTVKSFVTDRLEALSKVAESFSDLNARVAIFKKNKPDQRQILLSFDNDLVSNDEAFDRIIQILNSLKEFRKIYK